MYLFKKYEVKAPLKQAFIDWKKQIESNRLDRAEVIRINKFALDKYLGKSGRIKCGLFWGMQKSFICITPISNYFAKKRAISIVFNVLANSDKNFPKEVKTFQKGMSFQQLGELIASKVKKAT